MDSYLPVGSVVRLRSGSTVMIIGFGYYKDNKIYDYVGCDYEYGYYEKDKSFFNQKDIRSIKFMGYQNLETMEFQKQFTEYIDFVRKASKSGKLKELLLESLKNNN